MDRRIALKWARALESGEYNQTTGGLRDTRGFCCLGVLCNLHAQAHPEAAATQESIDEYFGESTVLPEEVIAWAGMHSDNGLLDTRVYMQVKERTGWDSGKTWVADLVELNDEHEFDFKKIAKVIREHSDKL